MVRCSFMGFKKYDYFRLVVGIFGFTFYDFWVPEMVYKYVGFLH
jgi:hypothetical protein